MDILQTQVKIPDPGFTVNYHSKLFLLGSCFADNMGQGLENLKFNTCVNPFGVLYNPCSIANNIQLLLNKEEFTGQDISKHEKLWFSFAHYTLFSNPDKTECLKTINTTFSKAKQQVRSANVLFITLGTSWYYIYKKTNTLVANCHKIPANEFRREFSDTANNVRVLSEVITQLTEINPQLQIVFTVSPIRHWKDGAIENQRSKSALILSIQELQNNFNNIYYFPAYEIFMDELRDYRFYASDMLHPSELAQEIIWDKFSDTFFTDDTKGLVKSVTKIKQALEHTPRFPNTQAYSQFKASLHKKMEALEQQYSFLNFDNERS